MTEVQPLVKVSGLRQYIRDRLVLDGVSFEVFPGDLFVLYGPSGGGKTVLISVLAGIQAHSAGRVETCGRGETGLVTQEESLFPDFTAGENLQAAGLIRGMDGRSLRRRMEELAAELRLGGVWRDRVRRLPWGPRRRLALACALVAAPRLLLVDDILFRGDPESSRMITDTVRSYVAAGNACVWATGRRDEAAALAGGGARVALLDGGRLTVCDDPGEFLWATGEEGGRPGPEGPEVGR
ncbi:MAG: ATP-binding cassette domain-containing protein [Bacillota bacterium]|nr:ATP-binding cassette domain-containing protein [Bacillota bacterium]